MARSPAARCILLWRGKLLVVGEALDQLALTEMTHPLVRDGPGGVIEAPFFLGLSAEGAPLFAADISAWAAEGLDLTGLGEFVDRSEQQHPDLPEGHVFAELRRIMTRLSPRDAELAASAKAVIGWHETHRFCARCGAASDVSQGGWQRSCPSCGGQHFPRTDPVVIMLITHGDSVLMGRSPGWPEGMFSLLAGFVEPGETLEAAVRREVMEEAGVPVGAVSYLSSQPWPFPASLMFGCAGEAPVARHRDRSGRDRRGNVGQQIRNDAGVCRRTSPVVASSQGGYRSFSASELACGYAGLRENW